jgi:hypothetical protein
MHVGTWWEMAGDAWELHHLQLDERLDLMHGQLTEAILLDVHLAQSRVEPEWREGAQPILAQVEVLQRRDLASYAAAVAAVPTASGARHPERRQIDPVGAERDVLEPRA